VALTSYEGLKREIVNLSHRDDIELGETLTSPINGLAATFIDIAESEMLANQTEILKLRGEEARATDTLSTSSRYLALPTGYKAMRRVRLELSGDRSSDVKYRAPEQLTILSTTGIPRFFTVTSEIEFDRLPDSAYSVELQYYADILPLSTTNATNDVLTNYPNVYLFGAMWALKNWADEQGESDRYYGMFMRAIKGANKKSRKGRYGPAPIMRIKGSTP